VPRRLAVLGVIASLGLAVATVKAWAVWRAPTTVKLVRDPAAGPATYDRVYPAPASPPMPVRSMAAPSPPVRVQVPAAGINASIVAEPLGAGGTLLIPPPRQVGWYEAGPAPGQPGATVLAGHIDYDGVPGALIKLAAVPDDAGVLITTASGHVFTYVVTDRLLIAKQSLASSGLLQSRGPSTLILVSCGGAYLAARHAYADNVIVVAEPAAGPPESGR
jgi:Sortase domain